MAKSGMHEGIHLIQCSQGNKWLDVMTRSVGAGLGPETPIVQLNDPEKWCYDDINGRRVILAYDLNVVGCNTELDRVLEKLYHISLGAGKSFENTVFGLLVTSENDQFTKSSARSVIYVLNRMGIEFTGHPIVEATQNLENLSKWRKNLNKPESEILMHLCSLLGEKLQTYGLKKGPEDQQNEGECHCKKIVVIHASDRKTSNTLLLWDMVRPHIKGAEVTEISLEEGNLNDCKGCLFETCLKFGAQRACYYKDVITQTVLPAIEEADAVVWLCPNYNDTVGARIMTLVNRLTVLYRRVKLDRKLIFTLVVSGNSGGDCVASQLIGALNINKGFHLPGAFAFVETANAPRSILSVKDVDARAERFAGHMNKKIRDFY